MDNDIILGVIAVRILVAISTIVKRTERKGCCRSSGDYKPRKKKQKT